MIKKYEMLDDDTVDLYGGQTLKRIRALITIPGAVEAGELGGYIENELNLSHEGDAWVYGDARVYGNARVYGDAWVYGDARVHGDAWVYGDARVYGDASVRGNAKVHGDAWVYGNAKVYGDAEVFGDARVYGDAWVYGDAEVYGDAKVFGDAEVYGDARVYDNDMIFWVSKVGTENGTLTVYTGKGNEIVCTRGCFYGTVDEFLAASKEKHDKRTREEYKLLIKVAKSRIERGLNKA